MLEDGTTDVRTFHTRNPDSDTVSCLMVDQLQYFAAIDLFDIHGNAFTEIWQILTLCPCSVLLCLIHISQELKSSCKIFMNSESLIPTFLTKLHDFLQVRWLNCWSNFVAIFIFFDLFSVAISLIEIFAQTYSSVWLRFSNGIW